MNLFLSDRPEMLREIKLLVFSMGTCRFGVDMDELAGIHKVDSEFARELDMIRFHEFPGAWMDSYNYRAPMILHVKNSKPPSGVVIDHMTDINVAVPVERVIPLPYLIKIVCANTPVWAATLLEEKIVLLVDFERLANQ